MIARFGHPTPQNPPTTAFMLPRLSTFGRPIFGASVDGFFGVAAIGTWNYADTESARHVLVDDYFGEDHAALCFLMRAWA